MKQIARAMVGIAMAWCWTAGSAFGAYEGIFEGDESFRKKAKIILEYEHDDLGPLPVVKHQRFDYYTLRLENPFQIAKGCELATRLDLPIAYSNSPSRDNPNGDEECGFSELLTQAIFIHTVSARWSWLVGLRAIWPTASQDQFGWGKIQMVPIAGIGCELPEISKGSSFVPMVRYAADVGGYGGRLHVSEWQIRPMVNIELPKGWSATLFPSADIRINLEDHGKLFLPFDAMISKTVTKNAVAYLEIGVPIIKQYRFYDFKVVAGVSFAY